MSINIDDVKKSSSEKLPVYSHFDGQVQPQPAYIELTEDGVLTADYNGEIGNGEPAYVWHNRTLRFSIPCNISGSELLSMVTELLPVFERLHAGHEVDWDGSNHVGKLSDDASQASDEIDSACNQLGSSGSLINIYTAEEYFFEYCSLLDAWSVDQTLAQAVEAAEIIIDEDQAVSDDIETAFLVKAEEVFEESPKTLGTTHIEALLGDDRISADDAAQWAADNK